MDGMREAYEGLAAASGWGPCVECGEWDELAKMVDLDGFYCHPGCVPAPVAHGVDLAALKANVERLAAGEGLSFLEAVSLLQTGAAAAGEEALLDALCELKRPFIDQLFGGA